MNADIYLGTPLLELTVHLQGDGSSWEVERAEEGNIGHLGTELLVRGSGRVVSLRGSADCG